MRLTIGGVIVNILRIVLTVIFVIDCIGLTVVVLMQEGMQKGLEKGMEKGLEKGLEKGMEKGIYLVAAKMKMQGIDFATITSVTGLNAETIATL